MSKMITMTIYLDEDLKKLFEDEAKKEDRNAGNYVRQILKKYAKDNLNYTEELNN